jgi:predicted amidohydrolase
MRGIFISLLGLFLLGCGDDPRNDDDDVCPAAPTDPTSARVFVIQPRIAPDNFKSYLDYHNHLFKLVETHVSHCVVADRPNIVVFPENTGITAAFIGSRGQAARNATSALGAFLALGGQYTQPIEFYKNSWPNLPLPNQIEIAVTDTVWRAFHETNQSIAQQLGVWVISSTNISGLVEKSTDPAEIAALGDPDVPDPAYVYVARDPGVYNTTFVYKPGGDLVAARKKPYLVAGEINDLALSAGPLSEAVPIAMADLGVGIFTSKDAWMPDLVDRLAALGADTFVQPEAFSGWTTPEDPKEVDAWAPDILSQSAMAAVRKHGGFRHGIVAHLTGNLFDTTFDGQSIILRDPVPGERTPAYVGEPDEGGVLAVAPWVTPDPIVDDPTASLAVRRAKLRASGEERLPGGARANEYVETGIAADLSAGLPTSPDGPAGILGPSRAISSTGEVAQSHPAVAWTNTSPIIVAFQEGARGATRIMVATSEDQGKTFGAPHLVTSAGAVQITPAVAVTGTYVYAAWQERDKQGARIACAVSNDRGKTFGSPSYLPSTGGIADAWMPTFAAANGRVFLAYVDGSSGNERVVLAQAAEGSVTFTVKLVEPTMPHPTGDVRNNQWSPAIAANGNDVAAAWVDFRNANWDVFLSRSADGGTTFGAPIRLDDGSDNPERLHDDPFLMFLPGVNPLTLAASWSDVRQRQRFSSARMSLVAGAVIGQSRPFGAMDAASLRPNLAPLGPSKVAMVWQDDRTLGQDIFVATSSDGGVTFGMEQRVDDGGNGASYQTAPVVAADGLGALLVAWEDSRSGTQRIRFVLGKP